MMRLIDLLSQRGLVLLTSKPLEAYMVRRPHHLVNYLRERGVRVELVSWGGFRRWRPQRLFYSLNRWKFRRFMARLAREGPALWVSGVPYWWAWEGLGWALVIHDLTDFMPGFGFREDDVARSLREADIVFAVSGALARWAENFSERVLVLENGVNPQQFAPAARHSPKSWFAFWGAFSTWVRLEFLEAVAEAGLPLKLAGRVHRGNLESLLKRPNVKFFGELPYGELPKFLADVKVALLPFDFAPVGVGYYSCPLKLFEAWAAGAAVLSTPIAVAQEKAEPGVLELARTPEEFARKALELAERANPAACLARARAQSWETLLSRAMGTRL